MSSIEVPITKITYNTAQNISDEILNNTIKFCKETEYNQNISTLTFFWTAFLFTAKNKLDEYSLTKKIMDCYISSLNSILPKLSEDTKMQQDIDNMQKYFWNNIYRSFATIKTESDILELIEFANKMNIQYNAINFNLNKDNIKNYFAQILNSINLSINNYINLIKNDFKQNYKDDIKKFNDTQIDNKPIINRPINTSNETNIIPPTSDLNINEKPLGMAWYKFLIYFALIAGAIINILYGIGYISGGIYSVGTNGEISAEQIYAHYGAGLQALDALYGLSLIAFAILALVLRHKLANYEPDAIKYVKIFYSISIALPFVYAAFASIITQEPSIFAEAFGSSITSAVFLIVNVKYFNNRAHLFVGKTETVKEINPSLSSYVQNNLNDIGVQTMTSTISKPQKALYCRKCGTKLVDDSIYCHNCGTKIY